MKKDKKENTEVTEQTQVSVEDFQFETEYTDDKKDEITNIIQQALQPNPIFSIMYITGIFKINNVPLNAPILKTFPVA